MGKNPAFLFYPGDWKRDTGLQMASTETRGVWIQMIVCMFDAPEYGKLTGTIEQISRLLSCDTNTVSRAIIELERLKIGDVTICNDEWCIICRRMYREHIDRENTRLRVKQHRVKRQSNKDVTTDDVKCNIDTSVSVSYSNKKDIRIELGCAYCVWWTYVKEMNKNGACQFTGARYNKIRSRLKDSTINEIYKAIIACSKSPFHMGKNENNKTYNDIANNILKSREKVEWWNDRVAVPESPWRS